MQGNNTPAYTAEQLCGVINSILHCVDNNERRHNETELTQALQQPQNVGQLVTVLCGTPDGAPSTASAGARQLAAVLLRKRVFSLWRVLTPEQQQQLRHLLLQQLGNETVRSVRFAIAHVVTRLAKADANQGGGGWPELQQAIRVAADDSRVEMRELAMVLLYSFGEVFAEENALSGLAAESVVRGLGDSETVVQAAAVKAAMVLLPTLHEHPAVRNTFLSHLAPACIAVLDNGAAVEAKVPLCVSVLELLEQLFDDLPVKKYGALLQELAQALMRLLANPQNHPRVRENCGTALGQLATLKPKFVATQHMLDPLVQVCLALMAEDNTISISQEGNGNVDGEEFDDSSDEDIDMLHVISSCMVGGRLLSALATTVASKAFTAVLLPYISKVTDAPANVDARTRKATMIALACLAEGHSSYLRRRVGYVLTVTRTLLHDADPVPREAAAFALSYFCAHLQPEILLHREELLPMLVPLLHDSNDLVRRRVAEALDTLCENLEEHLDPYVPTLLPAVMAAIPISSLETQCRLCGVLSSMGMTHSAAFASHGPELLELLRQPFTLNTPETMALRAQATETVGVVGAAMGREAFAPFFPCFMQEVVANLQTRHAAVREQSFGFLANMCELFKDDFLVYLNDSLRCALETIEEDRAVYKNKHLLAKDGGGGGGSASGSGGADALASFAAWKDDKGEDDETDEDGGDDDAAEIHLRVRTADVEEKSSAVYSVGVFADVLMGRFGEEQIAACWEALMGLDSHYYPNIRSNAIIALAKLAKASAGLPAAEMQACSRATAAGQDALPLPVRDRIDELLGMLLRTIEEETSEKEVVGAACESIGILLGYFGTQCCIDGPDAVLRDAVQLLRGTMPCQRDGDDFDDDDEDHDDDDSAEDLQNMSYEEYQRRQQTADPAAADKSYFKQGKDPLFRRQDEAVDAQASAAMSAMLQHQQSGATAGPPPQLPQPSALPPWYTYIEPSMVVQGVHLAEDHDEVVIDAAAEMLESVAKAYGPLLQPYMPFLVPLLALHADVETRPAEGLVTGVGTLASVLQAYVAPETQAAAGGQSAEQLLAPYMETAVQVSFAVMAGSDESTAKANSAYLLRILVEGCPAYFAQHPTLVPQCFQGLWSIVGNEEEEIPEAVDNAVSATCSFVRCLPFQHLPVDQVIPALMAHLPMKMDKAENANAIRTVCYLLSAQHDAAAAAATTWLPSVVGAVASILAACTVEEAEKQLLVQQGAAVFAQAHPDAWRQASQQTLSSEQQSALRSIGL